MTSRDFAKPLCWAYFVLAAPWTTVGIYSFSRIGFTAISASSTAIDLCCMLGLFGFVSSRPIVTAFFWKAIWGLYIVKVSLALLLISSAGHSHLIVQAVAGAVFAIPLMVALWQYSFRSSALWGVPQNTQLGDRADGK